jgi:Nucleotidyl transferase of unknown function (DUF2204)
MTKAANQRVRLPITSSAPLKLPAKQTRLFREVLTLFEREHLPSAVSGAFALERHTGVSRSTKDLDIFLRPDDISNALVHLTREGFRCEIRDPVWLAKAHRDGYFVDLMSNGVITVDESWIRRSHPATILGIKTRVLAPEELFASKLFVTRRERFDGADIAHIIFGTKGRLDWARILQVAGEHWELVLWNLMLFRYVYPAHSSYVPQGLWQRLLRKFAENVRCRDSKAAFRGSLIDHRMFAVDVEEWGLKDMLKEFQERSRKIRRLPRSRKCTHGRSQRSQVGARSRGKK